MRSGRPGTDPQPAPSERRPDWRSTRRHAWCRTSSCRREPGSRLDRAPRSERRRCSRSGTCRLSTCVRRQCVDRWLTPLLRRLIACGRLRAGPEEELLHFRLQELARLGLDRRQPILVDEHGLVLQPARPAFPGDTLLNAPAELTRIRGALESRGLALQKNTLHHA